MAKTKERQIAYPVCQDVPNQVNFFIYSIKYQIIISNMYQICVDVPAEVCHNVPQQKCAQKPFEVCKGWG